MAVELSNVSTDTAITDDIAKTLAGTLKFLTSAAVGAYASLQIAGRGIVGVAAAISEEWEKAGLLEKANPLAPLVLLGRTVSGVIRGDNEAAKAAADDLSGTIERYANLINSIQDAGSGSASNDTVDRITQMRKSMDEFRNKSYEAAGSNSEFSQSAKDAADKIQEEITALDRAAAVWGMSADQVKIYDLTALGATDTQLKMAEASLQEAAAKEAQKTATESYLSLVKELQTDEEKRTDQLKERLAVLDAIKTASDQDYSRVAQAAFEEAPDYGGIAPEIGGAMGELSKIDEAQEKLETWYQTQIDMLAQFRSERADLAAQWDEQEVMLEEKRVSKLMEIEKARQIAQLSSTEQLFGTLAGLTKTFLVKAVGHTRRYSQFRKRRQSPNLSSPFKLVLPWQQQIPGQQTLPLWRL